MGLRNPFRRKPARDRRVAGTSQSSVGRSTIHTADNAGTVSLNTQGHLAYGVGAGIAVDAVDGSIGVQMGGITVDTPSYDSSPAYCAPTSDSSPSYSSSDSGSSYSSSSYDSGSSYSSSDSGGSSFSSCD